MSVIIFNEIDKIYSKGILKSDGVYLCSVCNRSYKSKKYAEKHYNKKQCYNYVNVFKDTHVENNLYLLYTQILSIYHPKSIVTKRIFRKSSRYNIMCQLYHICSKNKIGVGEYLNYILKNIVGWNPFMIIKRYTKNHAINDFMVYRRFNRNDIDSLNFFEKHKQTLSNDSTFVLRTIKRGDINISNLFQYMDFECFIDRLTSTEKVILIDLLQPHGDSVV